jgi:hypothetical protein
MRIDLPHELRAQPQVLRLGPAEAQVEKDPSGIAGFAES